MPLRMIIMGMISLLSLITCARIAGSPEVGISNPYVEYHPSSGLRVILTSPHGGYQEPASIPDRDAGCWNNATGKCIWNHTCGEKDFTRCKAITEADLYTLEMTLELRDRLCQLFRGACPAAILNLLARRKFDANRDVDEGTFDVPEVVTSFETFHGLAEAEMTRMGYVGLFLDIHGHGHKLQRAELGYLPRGKELDSGDPIDPNRTSIRGLAERFEDRFRLEDLLRGKDSFGAFLGAYGFDSVPSPVHRGPGGEQYFNGGYNTRRHGSLNGGSFDAIQIESARSHRVDPATRRRYVDALACSVRTYFCNYYLDLNYNRTYSPKLSAAETGSRRPSEQDDVAQQQQMRVSDSCRHDDEGGNFCRCSSSSVEGLATTCAGFRIKHPGFLAPPLGLIALSLLLIWREDLLTY